MNHKTRNIYQYEYTNTLHTVHTYEERPFGRLSGMFWDGMRVYESRILYLFAICRICLMHRCISYKNTTPEEHALPGDTAKVLARHRCHILFS
jgi:hypothetical protein